MLLVRVERCLRTTGISAARFGRDSVGDPRFVSDLRRGREARNRTTQRVLVHIEKLEAAKNAP